MKTPSEPSTYLGLLAGAVLLALAVTFWPLLREGGVFGTPEQAALSLWGVWWPAVSFTRADLMSLHSTATAPVTVNQLRYLPVAQSFVWHGLRPLLGPVGALTALLGGMQAGTLAATATLLRRWGIVPAVAVLGGLLVALSPWYLTAIHTADVTLAALGLLPLAVLLWERALAERSPVWLGLTVVVLYAAVLCGTVHLAWIVGVWLPYAFWKSAADPPPGTAAAALFGLLLLLIYPLPNLITVGFEVPYAPRGAVGAARDASVLGLLGMTLGPLIPLAVVAASLRTRRAEPVYLIAGAVALLMGLALLPEPLRVLAALTGLDYRPLYDPSAFLGVGVVILTGAAVRIWGEALFGLLPAAGIGAAAVAAALLIGPRPAITQPPVHEVYSEIAADREDYVVLHYPFGVRSVIDGEGLGRDAHLAALGAVWHHKRTAGGVVPYLPPRLYDDHYGLEPYLLPEDLTRDDLPEAAAALGDAVTGWRIGYVLAHTEHLSAEQLRAIDALAGASGALCAGLEQGELIVYRARWQGACP